jgi:hypothetical protein
MVKQKMIHKLPILFTHTSINHNDLPLTKIVQSGINNMPNLIRHNHCDKLHYTWVWHINLRVAKCWPWIQKLTSSQFPRKNKYLIINNGQSLISFEDWKTKWRLIIWHPIPKEIYQCRICSEKILSLKSLLSTPSFDPQKKIWNTFDKILWVVESIWNTLHYPKWCA